MWAKLSFEKKSTYQKFSLYVYHLNEKHSKSFSVPPEVTSKPAQALQIDVQGSISFVIYSYPAPNVLWFNRSSPLDNQAKERKNGLNNNKNNESNTEEIGTTTNFINFRDDNNKKDVPSTNYKQRYTTQLFKTGLNSYVAVLHLTKVTKYELGKYSIKVTNDIGEISSTVDVVQAGEKFIKNF